MEVRARAPGKIILAGEHAVVHGSAAVAAAIDLYTHASIHLPEASSGDGVVELNLKDSNLVFSWPCSRLQAALRVGEQEGNAGNISSLPKPCLSAQLASIVELLEEHEIPESKIFLSSGLSAFLFLYTSILGFRPGKVVISSDLPLGAGLGSSAAFCVSLSGALLALSGVVHVEGNGGSESWVTFGKDDLELVNRWAFEGEKIIHGKPSGIDNAVSTFGSMIKFKKGEMSKIKSSTPVKMLITDTRVGRNTKALVASVSERAARHPNAMASVFHAVDSISQELSTIVELPASDEIALTLKEEKLVELMEMNQGLLQCMGVSHVSIETVLRTTLKYQLISKLTGAGGGGCVLTLLPSLSSSIILEKVICELESHGFRCFKVEVGGEGLQIFRS